MPLNRFLPDADVTLDLPEIQGDILIGLKKNAEVFVFFRITDVVRFRTDLGEVLGDITFSDRMKAVEEAKQQGAIPLFLGFNIAFTAGGLAKLRPGDDFGGLDPVFIAGAGASRADLGDAHPWLPPYEEAIDGVLIATGVDPATAGNHADGLADALRHSIQVVRKEPGLVRSGDQRGHEHFGFADGISQPGVKGLTQPGDDPDQGLPGQDLVEPGEFVFGYPTELEGIDAVPPLDWMRNGSYLVFRRLNQDVPAFDAYLAAEAGKTPLQTAERLGAHLIGRWKSGAPTVLTPFVDNVELAGDPMRNNDFEFGEDVANELTADPHQQKCPFVAHIRKMYPRQDFGPGPLLDEPERRRILRAGIPFGRDEDADKGLLFACYQTSISDKFEFLQRNWANAPGFMIGKSTASGTAIMPGLDITIGQGGPRTPQVGDDPLVTLADAPPFVFATGAVYLFSPSRAALEAFVAG